MVFKGKREGSVITGGMESDSAGLWGSHGFQGEAEGEISHHGGGGGARTLEESLGFQGGRGDQSQLTDIKGKT